MSSVRGIIIFRSNRPRERETKSEYAFLVFASCFVLALVMVSLTFNSRDSQAIGVGSTTSANVEVASVIAMALIPDNATASATDDRVSHSGEVVTLASYDAMLAAEVITPSPTTVQLNVTPTPAGMEATGNLVINVSSNNPTGYTLTMSAKTSNTALIHTNGTNTIPSTTNPTAATLPTNTWGYNVGPNATTFLAIPAPSGAVTLRNTTGPTASDDTAITIGAKTDINVLPGVYSNDLTFTAVANYFSIPTVTSASPSPTVVGGTITIAGSNFFGGSGSNMVTQVTVGGVPCTRFLVSSDTLLVCVVPSLADGTYPIAVTTQSTSNVNVTVTIQQPAYPTMQAFNTAACNAMPIYYPTASPPAGSEVDLLDTRDMKVYKVRKLPSNTSGTTGWCWMVDNLAIEPAPANTQVLLLESTNSDFPTAANHIFPMTSTSFVNPNTAPGQTYCANLSTATYPHKCGMRYEFVVAIAGASVPTAITLPDSICPRNWRLPADGEYATLQTALSWGSSGANVINSPWRGLYAGTGTVATAQGTSGFYWTATAASTTNAYRLSFFSGSVTPSVSTSVNAGSASSLRCLAR